ncbi:hypothetical protein D3C86_1597860 [compost metagenome]
MFGIAMDKAPKVGRIEAETPVSFQAEVNKVNLDALDLCAGLWPEPYKVILASLISSAGSTHNLNRIKAYILYHILNKLDCSALIVA